MTAARLVLHVGAHKTGTTLIQAALREHGDVLRGAGVAYFDHVHPDMLASGVFGTGVCLARHGPSHDMPGRFRAALDAAEGGDWQTALISSEAWLGPHVFRGEEGLLLRAPLYPFAPQMFAWLRDASDLPIRVVLYIRGQAGLLESLYGQLVMHGYAGPFESWMAAIDLDALSWRPIVEAAVASMGPGNLVLKGFQLPAIGPAAHLCEFVHDALDLPEIDVDGWTTEQANLSLSGLGLMIRRRLADVPLEDHERRALTLFLKRHFTIAQGEAARPMRDDVRASIDGRYDAENAALLAEFGAPRDRTRGLP